MGGARIASSEETRDGSLQEGDDGVRVAESNALTVGEGTTGDGVRVREFRGTGSVAWDAITAELARDRVVEWRRG